MEESKLRVRLLEVSRGDVKAASTALEQSTSASVVLGAALHAVHPTLAPPPTLEAMRDAMREHPSASAAVARLVLSAIGSFEFGQARDWLRLFEGTNPPEIQLVEAGLRLVCERSGSHEIEPLITELGKRAAAEQRPFETVEATVWLALSALHSGDLETALKHARRGSRIARTESIPQLQYFANVVLACIRRLRGTPHLGSRILRALGRVASPAWLGWISWELLWVDKNAPIGELELRAGAHISASIRISRALQSLFVEVEQGTRQGMDAKLESIQSSPQFAMFADELTAYREGLSAEGSLPFVRGQDHRIPLGLDALASGSSERSAAVTLLMPDAPPRRIFSAGYRLGFGDMTRLPRQKGQDRLDTTTNVLAFAGTDGIATPEAFEQIYGFGYIPITHSGTFRVMLHHLRKHLEGFAEITREGGRLYLRVTKALAVPDPRCEDSPVNRVLRVLGDRQFGARQISTQLGIPNGASNELEVRITISDANRATAGSTSISTTAWVGVRQPVPRQGATAISATTTP